MVSEELKMNVAQNCNYYRPNNIYVSMSVGTLQESCNNCANYNHSQKKCSKNMFAEIERAINFN